jgi:predicted alpha/beta hydrolase family esterase
MPSDASRPLRILILPGLGGSGPAHWQTLWEARDPRCVRVEQRSFDYPDRDHWVDTLDRAIGAGSTPVVLVAHSLACALVAHWAERHGRGRGARAVEAALLVAPADVDAPERTPPETRGFAPLPTGRLPFPAAVVASHDDPFVAFERGRALAASWGARFVDAGCAGHINAASGLGDWPEGRRTLEELLSA